MKRFFFLLTALMAVFQAFANDAAAPKGIELTDSERQLVQNNNRFAFDLFSKVREAPSVSSFVLSPLSVTIDLSMLNNGADGVTRQEIDAVLGSETAGGADVLNSFCRKLLTESGNLDAATRVAMANNIYVNSAFGDELLPAFVETASRYYDAVPESRDFSDGETCDAINRWAADRTEGMIEEAIKEDEFYPNAVSYLLNALYFKGEWTHKFDANGTQRVQFDEGRAEADMMSQYSQFSYAVNDVYQSVILPYGNKAYQMTVFLPWEGKSLRDVVERLKGQTWDELQHDYGTSSVVLFLPKFETFTDMRLEDIMASLGMPNAFEGGYGFNKFCNGNVYIGMMKQTARLRLDEAGTEASAVTVIETRKNISVPSYAEFVADRPFLYVISERSTGTIFFIGQYMGEPLDNPRQEISLTDEEKQLVENNNDFAFNLFRKARGEESSIMSPLSITYALGMLNNGAAGQTQQEINNVLGFGEAGADGINRFCRKLLTEAPTLDKTTAAEIANTIFLNSGMGYELQQDFSDKVNAYYDVQPQALNFFEKKQAMDVINAWANDHTHGMIPSLFDDEDSFDETAASYLLNALYFKGAWKNKFDKENTQEEPFNGGLSEPMMHQWERFDYTENDLYQAVRLPYGNEAYSMTVFLPRKGKTVGDVLEQMNGKNWRFTPRRKEVDLKLPRIETGVTLPLNTIMSELGMPTAFSPQDAEFPYVGNQVVYIGNMFQKAVIEVDEEGTKAAAVTVVAESTGIPQYVDFHANRPFFYIISEQSTGTIFFIGQYMGKGMVSSIASQPLGQDNGKAAACYYDLCGRRLSAPPAKGLYIDGTTGRKILAK